MAVTSQEVVPKSVLILGSGVFGLSTAYSLTQNPKFANTSITLVDRSAFPAPDGASIDSSRIVRPDYADLPYARLAIEAQARWRNEWWGQQDVYHEPGLAVVVNKDESDNGNGDLGRKYMRDSMANVERCGLKPGKKSEGGEIEAMETQSDIRNIFRDNTNAAQETAVAAAAATGKGGSSVGDFGYVNWRSGWADAEKGMRVLRARVEETNRVNFLHASVSRLQFSNDAVTGCETDDGRVLTADLVVLATGAWTPALLDLRGRCSATGQILSYIKISDAEQEALGERPTLLNESSGLFIIPPVNNVLKVARHGYGYCNPVSIPHPEDPSLGKITVSLPRTHISHPGLEIPSEGKKALRSFLAAVYPSLATRPFISTRICWYTDTPRGDWLLSYHPRYKNLFVATGGSGHAYKFLPVVGDKVVDCLLGNPPAEFKDKWAWPERDLEDQVWTKDWRGGVKGMVLEDELQKGEDKAKL
ncbi:FAD dependent oxidoreductase [Aureobasidium pullulans]|nr:FAD dependent oxidoreductase [Aureobasidium pullulans]THX89249.1 FAD dependent oxidoreductase [Aureobasidium pullulans]